MKTKAWLALIALLCGLALPQPLAAASFIFYWKASTNPSVIAYGIYQRRGSSDYLKIDEVMIKDLEDPNKPSYVFSGLTDGNTYWFAVTFIDDSGDESELFHQTCIKVDGQVEDCHDDEDEDQDDGTTVYINCFIRSAGEWFFKKSTDR
jgi:hypothetical protein